MCTHRLVQREGRKGKYFLTPNSQNYSMPLPILCSLEETSTVYCNLQTPRVPSPRAGPFRRFAWLSPWGHLESRPATTYFTHHSPTGTTRINRFYMSTGLIPRKTGVDIIPASFTDHHVAVLRITVPESSITYNLVLIVSMFATRSFEFTQKYQYSPIC
jgi:hypothetical protein